MNCRNAWNVYAIFANAAPTKGGVPAPVIRAIVLHFMLAYDHPFWDGNGRCARALFYWCVLRHGYWLLEYVSISAVIRRAPVKYGMAFLYTETDEGDVTYFIDHQAEVIEKSVSDLKDYLVKKTRELGELGKTLGVLERQLNRRQKWTEPPSPLVLDPHGPASAGGRHMTGTTVPARDSSR